MKNNVVEMNLKVTFDTIKKRQMKNAKNLVQANNFY